MFRNWSISPWGLDSFSYSSLGVSLSLSFEFLPGKLELNGMDNCLIWLGFCLFLVGWACCASFESKLVLIPAGLLPSFVLLRLSFIVSYLPAPLSNPLSPKFIGLLLFFSIFFDEIDLWRANSGELLSKELILLCVSLLIVYLLFFNPSLLFFISYYYFVKIFT